MRSKWALASTLAAVILASATIARAQEGISRPMLLTLDPGFCFAATGPNHVTGSPSSAPYLGGTLQLDLRGPVAANVFVGIGGCTLAVAGGTARYAGPWYGHVRVTAGAGPMIGYGMSMLAEGDLALEVRSSPGFVLALGPKAEVTLNRSGGSRSAASCVDDCASTLPAGTWSFLLRLGVGFNI